MSGDNTKPPTAEEVLITAGVITPATPQQSGIERLGQDWNALSSAATNAISTGWDQHVAPEIKKFGGDFEAIADDGRRKWSDLSSAVTGAVTHPATEAMPLLNKVMEAEKYYHLQGHGGEALRNGAAFAVETVAAAVSVVAEDLQQKAGEIESGVQKAASYVSSKLPTFKP